MSHANHVNSVNLIPASRRDAKRRRRHLRWCAGGCATYALAVGACCLACTSLWGGSDPAREELVKVNAEIEKSNHTMASVRADAATANSTLTVTRAIADQPDWSTLLALLSQNVRDDIVLRSCALKAVVN